MLPSAMQPGGASGQGRHRSPRGRCCRRTAGRRRGSRGSRGCSRREREEPHLQRRQGRHGSEGRRGSGAHSGPRRLRHRRRRSARGSGPPATSRRREAPRRAGPLARPTAPAPGRGPRRRDRARRRTSRAVTAPGGQVAATVTTPTGGSEAPGVLAGARARRPMARRGRNRSCESPALATASSVSSATIRPPWRIATRSASASTSPGSWVVRRMVRPSLRSDAMTERVSRRAAGSNPAVGSSRINTSGSPTRASASDRRCRSPPDRRRTRVPATSPRPTCSMSSSAGAHRRGRLRTGARDRVASPSAPARRRPEHQPDARGTPGRRVADPRRRPAPCPRPPRDTLDDLDQRRLAGSVRPDECNDLAGPHCEVHAIEDPAPAVRLRSLDFDHGPGDAVPEPV